MFFCTILQDSNPAGTIFAEDIVDVTPDYEESKKVCNCFKKFRS